jgi:hypothetical protein
MPLDEKPINCYECCHFGLRTGGQDYGFCKVLGDHPGYELSPQSRSCIIKDVSPQTVPMKLTGEEIRFRKVEKYDSIDVALTLSSIIANDALVREAKRNVSHWPPHMLIGMDEEQLDNVKQNREDIYSDFQRRIGKPLI